MTRELLHMPRCEFRPSSLFVSLQPGALSCHNYMSLWERRHICSRRHFKSEIILRSLQRRNSSHKASARFPPDRPAALPWCHVACGVTTGCSDTCAEIIQRAKRCVQPINTPQKQGFPKIKCRHAVDSERSPIQEVHCCLN